MACLEELPEVTHYLSEIYAFHGKICIIIQFNAISLQTSFRFTAVNYPNNILLATENTLIISTPLFVFLLLDVSVFFTLVFISGNGGNVMIYLKCASKLQIPLSFDSFFKLFVKSSSATLFFG